MYFSRIMLRPDAPQQRSFWTSTGGEYNTHRKIWRLFHNNERDFLYRQENYHGIFRFYIVSAKEPLDSDGLWEVECRKYTPKLYVGQKLWFSVRVNPVRTRHNAEGKHHRHDVVMEAKRTLREKNQYVEEVALIQREGYTWLTTRAETSGFTVSDRMIQIDNYQQHKLYKSNKTVIRFSTLEYTGILEVVNPTQMIKTLYCGLGHAKGFGCGLMLVRPT